MDTSNMDVLSKLFRGIGVGIYTICDWALWSLEHLLNGYLDFRKTRHSRSAHICGEIGQPVNCPRCVVERDLDIPDIEVMYLRVPPQADPYPVVDRRWASFHIAYQNQWRRLMRGRRQRQLGAARPIGQTDEQDGL